MLSNIIQDARLAIRMLIKNPGFAAVVIVTLSLAIGANTAIFSMIDAVLLRPLPYPEPDRLVMLWEHSARRGLEQEKASGPDLIDWQAQSHSFENVAFWTDWGPVNVVDADRVEKVRVSFVSSTLFHVLRTAPLLGRTFLPEEDQHEGGKVAVLGYGLWQRRFGGKREVLGQTVTTDTYGRREYTIVGVMPPDFAFPDQCELWLPAGWTGVRLDERRSAHWYQVLARLKPGVTTDQALSEMGLIQSRIERQHPQDLIGSDVSIVPLLDQTLGRNLRRALLTLWGIVVCVLLIACANVANLVLARTAARQKEIALRVAMGAGRGRIVRQLLTESLLLAVCGGGLGVLLALWALDLLAGVGANYMPRLTEVRLDAGPLVFTLLISAATAVLFGFAPAWQFAAPDCNQALKEGSRGATVGRGAARLRNLLVVGEVALSLMLLVGAGLMTNSFLRLVHMNRGFRADHLLTAELDFSVSGFTTWIQPTSTRPQVTLHEILQRLANQPGVQSAAVASKLPKDTGSARTQTITIEGREATAAAGYSTADFQGISPDYFRTMGIPLLHGRPFTERDDFGAEKVVITNAAFARRYFPNEDPLDKHLAIGSQAPGSRNPGIAAESQWKRIVGIVPDVRSLDLGGQTMPVVYVPYWQWPMQSPTLIVRTAAEPASIGAVVRGEVRTANGNLPPPTMRTMDDLLADSVAQPRFHTLLCGLFGIEALVLAVVGIYGTISYSVVQRTHEFGVRMALGARRSNVLALVLGQGMRLTLCGLGIGLFLSFALTRVIANQLFGVTPTDPATFAAVSLLLVLVALLACYLPARRATKVDPMVALRYE